MSHRETLNEIKQRHNLNLVYQDEVTGLSHAQVWLGTWRLNGGVVIGHASETSRVAAKEEASRLAIQYLNARGLF